MPNHQHLRPVFVALALLAALPAALAHDTWFQRLPGARSGEVMLAIGTGNQFPVQEFAIGIEQLRGHGCRGADASAAPLAAPLVAFRRASNALIVRADLGRRSQPAPVTCWAQLMPFELELPSDKIELYLKEVQPPQSVLDTWAAMRARGLPWKERYTKHARVEIAAGDVPAAAAPVAMGMDMLLESGLQAIHEGDPLVFRVLRDGAPLPNFSVELRGERSRFGIWRRTDAQGRVAFPAPLAGRWVLRGIDLRLSETQPDTWDSRFVTLAFEIGPSQNGKSSTSNSRSASQMAEMPAISSEPPTSTQR